MHPLPLLKQLSDGKFHSGEELGASLGVSRMTVWNDIRGLADYGVTVQSVKGKGYRLHAPLELLDAGQILALLDADTRKRLQQLEVLFSVDSTNAWLMRQVQAASTTPGVDGAILCLAETQTAGRGRRGREWVSPFGHNLYFSLGQQFRGGAVSLEGLSLVVGIAVVDALEAMGISGLSLKWPNDVLLKGHKLAGILLEMSGDVSGDCVVVIGIGLNLKDDGKLMKKIAQPWTDLQSHFSRVPGRNEVAARLLQTLLGHLDVFRREGLAAFLARWAELDAVAGREVQVDPGDGSCIIGLARGVDERGALRVQVARGERLFSGGEVSLRVQQQ